MQFFKNSVYRMLHTERVSFWKCSLKGLISIFLKIGYSFQKTNECNYDLASSRQCKMLNKHKKNCNRLHKCFTNIFLEKIVFPFQILILYLIRSGRFMLFLFNHYMLKNKCINWNFFFFNKTLKFQLWFTHFQKINQSNIITEKFYNLNPRF